MLKISTHTTTTETRIALEGRLAGPWLEELDRCWRDLTKPGPSPLIVDLTGVTFIDRDGKALLAKMWREGAELLAAGCCTKSIVEEITASGREG
jgi:anti-anti-sigma regulatory factor